MNIEQSLFDSLARVLLQTQTDQWWNTIDSPLTISMKKWAQDNREDIASEIMKKYKVEEFANMVSSKIIEELVKRNWQTNYKEQELQERVMEIIAEKLAKNQIKKLSLLK